MIKRLCIASDHGAIEHRLAIIHYLKKEFPSIEVSDLGTHTTDSVDYPDFADAVSSTILSDKADVGILCCGTGIGISIKANRYKGIRAAVVHDDFTAEMAKAHNNANILCLGGRTSTQDEACRYVKLWIETEFEGGRHQRRLDKLDI